MFTPFLTELDSRAQIKGSVDPLGTTPLWVRLGRRVIGNLTTVSNSVRDFKTLLLGFALIEDLHGRAAADEKVDDLGTFLRWEQVAAYTRLYINKDKNFRGTTRVQRRLNDSTVVPISKEGDCQILGAQQTYGLWGLFTVPSRASGLLQDDNRLTPEAREFVSRRFRRELAPIWSELLTLIAKDNRRVNLDNWVRTLKRLSRVWTVSDATDHEFWHRHLVEGGPHDPTEGRQALLARFLQAADDGFELSPAVVRSLTTKARRQDERLASYLGDIIAAEAVLAPATTLFGFLQHRNGQTVDQTVTAIQEAWPAELKFVDVDHFASLQPLVLQVTGQTSETADWSLLSIALRNGRYREVVERLLALNASVMKRRGAAPWIVEEFGLLRVRYRDDPSILPSKSELPGLWRHPYFIDSLRAVAHEIQVA